MYSKLIFKCIIFAFAVCMVFITGPAGADYKPDEKVLPLPTVELEIIIIRWLFDNGFDASNNTAAYNQTLIMVRKGDNKWQITVTAFSPLASRVSVTCLNNNEDKTELPGLWAYLDMYIQDEGTNSPFISESAPEFFRPYSESVVCIKGTNHKEPVQFTGFILDRDDIVISTAHDLEGVRNLEITFYNGKKTTGTIIRSDHEKDLSLIKINSAIKSSISLKKGRTLLNDNETVYSIGCPMNSNGKVHSGLIDGTIKRINSVFLWQAQIETRPGSSGSPVFDAEGNLVGVVKGSYRGTESIGFIISMRTVLDLLQEL